MDPSRPHKHFNTHENLAGFTELATPIWVFDVERHKMWWANPAGILFWEAPDLSTLLQRDFSTDSDMVRSRLRQIVNNGSGTERIQDSWTLYPNDEPKNVILSFSAVTIETSRKAVLVEVKQFVESQTDAESLRILEAARASALIVSTFSLEGRLLAQNPAALSCYGPPRAGVCDNEMACRFRDPEIANELLQIAQSGKSQDSEQVVWTQSGARVHRILARRGRDPVTGAFVTVVSEEDVTEQNAFRQQMQALNTQLEREVKERTRRLQASEERYLLATQSAAIWDLDLERDQMFVSPSFIEGLGFSADDYQDGVPASSIVDLIHPEDVASYRAALERHLKEPGVPFSHETRFRTGTGGYRWFHAQGRSTVGTHGRANRSIGLLTDITERKKLEASLFSTQRLEAIGQLTGGIAHDFNNLLTVILGNAELLDMAAETNHELAMAIKEAAEQGAALTRHLLAYSSKQTLRPQAVDLEKLVNRMSTTLLSNLGEGINLTTRIGGGLWSIYADAAQVENAIVNLAINARDAMPQGGELEICCRNRHITEAFVLPGVETSLQPGAYVEILICDTGEGMSAQTLQQAFEPFFTTKQVGQGSGLGLSMVFGFARQSGGGTVLKSNPGGGTSVSVFLPRSATDPTVLPDRRRLGPVLGNGENIHLLEDDSAVQSTLSGILEALNYRVTQSSDAAAAMRQMSQNPLPDLILADVVLPGGESGLEFVERLSPLFPEIKTVLMSGFVPDQKTQETLDSRGLILMQKPMDKAYLSQVLHTVLHGQS
jgi:PAS domain S-box-containing protein